MGPLGRHGTLIDGLQNAPASTIDEEANLIYRDWTLLFHEADLDAGLRHQQSLLKDRVAAIPETAFTSTSDEFLAARIASSLVVEAILLHEDRISVVSKDAKIDVSHDFNRGGWGDGPVYARGLEVTYTLPFSGDAELFKCRPNPFNLNPPRAVVAHGKLQFPIDQPDGDIRVTKKEFTDEVTRIKQYLSWQKVQIDQYNAGIEESARSEVRARRAELQRRASDLESLGYAVEKRASTATSAMLADASAARKAARRAGKRDYDVALSFAGEDREYVEATAKELDRLGVSVFYDRFEQAKLWGADLAEHLGKVYGQDSRFVVMFLSIHYASKAWPDHEKSFALGRHLKGETGRILPVRFDDTEIPGLPPTLGYLDLRVLTPTKLAELIRQKVDTPEG